MSAIKFSIAKYVKCNNFIKNCNLSLSEKALRNHRHKYRHKNKRLLNRCIYIYMQLLLNRSVLCVCDCFFVKNNFFLSEKFLQPYC